LEEQKVQNNVIKRSQKRSNCYCTARWLKLYFWIGSSSNLHLVEHWRPEMHIFRDTRRMYHHIINVDV
ncbi:hypothetical protein CR513_13085, partial [Mucuna pruriens]